MMDIIDIILFVFAGISLLVISLIMIMLIACEILIDHEARKFYKLFKPTTALLKKEKKIKTTKNINSSQMFFKQVE